MTDQTCAHNVPATLAGDVEHLARTGINPDCTRCPPVAWCEHHQALGAHPCDA